MNSMEIHRLEIFTDEGHLLFVNSMQAVCCYHVTFVFESESTLSSCLNVKELLARDKWLNDWAVFWVVICAVSFTVCPYLVTYAFQSEFTVPSCLNIKEFLAPNRHHIWNLSTTNITLNHNLLVRKQTLNHFAKLDKWLWCVVSTYLYGAFDCVFSSSHVRVSEWISNL